MNKDTIERMKCELDELMERIDRLNEFRSSINYTTVSPANAMLISRQCEVMRQYAEILTIRIELNEREVAK